MNLSPHFTLREMTVTAQPLPNTPAPEDVMRLISLCTEILEPLRVCTGPLRVTSGFRSPEVNRAVGGSKTSAHMRGAAADVVPVSVVLDYAWAELRRLVLQGLPIDQAIVYQRVRGQGWLHLGMARDGEEPRRQTLVQLSDRKTYVRWSEFGGSIYAA